MAYFVADEKLQGYYVDNGVKINIVKYHFECDDAASLPAQTAFISSKKVKISMASTAHVIDTDTVYKMDSSGAWVQQSQPWQPLADYSVLSNKPRINGHTLTGNQTGAALGLQDALTFDSTPTQGSTNPVTSEGIWTDQQRQDALQDEDRAALIELVDEGAKNELSFNENLISPITGTNTANGFTVTKVTNGGINIKKTGTPSNSTAYFTLKTVVGKSGRILVCGGQIDNVYIYSRNGSSVDWRSSANAAIEIPPNDVGQTFDMALMLNNSNGALNNITELTIYPMICTKSVWDVSQTFQPYRPSWQEMWDAIQALQ